MFTEKDYGRVLDERVAGVIKRYIDVTCDYARASIKGNVSPSLVRQVLDRNSTLTKNNSKAIICMVEIAKKNCEKTITQAKVDKKFFNSLK